MANRNDDIKQLFSHLGLNEQDYQELRRQGGGTEAERVTCSPASVAPPTRRVVLSPKPAASASSSGSSFNAHSQPRVYLPGLNDQSDSASKGSPVRVEPETVAPPRRDTDSKAAPVVEKTRWPLLASMENAPPRVAVVAAAPPPRNDPVIPVQAPPPRARPQPRGPVIKAVEPEAPNPASSVAESPVIEIAPGLKSVIDRLKGPTPLSTDRTGRHRLRYSPREPGQVDPQDPQEALGDVLSRISRPRR